MKLGFAAVQQAADEAKSGGTGSFGRLGFFGLKDGESIILRFLSPEPMVAKFYEFVQTREGAESKSTSFIVAPDFYSDDPDWQGEDWVLKFGGKIRKYGSSELEEPYAVTRTVGVAVVREEEPYTDDKGRRRTRTRDALREFTGKSDKTYQGREFLVVRQSYKNFWAPLVEYFHEYGTICDRDYKITRKGADKDTFYTVIPQAEDEDFNLDDLHARYGYGTGKDVDGNELTVDSDDRFLYCPQTLLEWGAVQASEERARHFLVGDNPAPAPARASGPSLSSGADEAQVAPPPDTGVSSLRERLERHR